MSFTPTPQTDKLTKLLLATFGQWHNGEIYASDVQAILQNAMGHVTTIERQRDEARTLIQSTVGGLRYLAITSPIERDVQQKWIDLEDKMKSFLERTRK